FSSSSAHHLYLHSFPTRRSSDLPFASTFVLLDVINSYLLSRSLRDGCTCNNSPKSERSFSFNFSWNLPHEMKSPATSVVSENNTDRKSTRLNSSHVKISYAVFCL